MCTNHASSSIMLSDNNRYNPICFISLCLHIETPYMGSACSLVATQVWEWFLIPPAGVQSKGIPSIFIVIISVHSFFKPTYSFPFIYNKTNAVPRARNFGNDTGPQKCLICVQLKPANIVTVSMPVFWGKCRQGNKLTTPWAKGTMIKNSNVNPAYVVLPFGNLIKLILLFSKQSTHSTTSLIHVKCYTLTPRRRIANS